jgi:hypothetical protein
MQPYDEVPVGLILLILALAYLVVGYVEGSIEADIQAATTTTTVKKGNEK